MQEVVLEILILNIGAPRLFFFNCWLALLHYPIKY